MRVTVSVPATNDRGPLYTDHALAAVHQANPHRLSFTLGIDLHGDEASLTCTFPTELRAIVEGQLFAQYPDSRIQAVGSWPPDLSGHRTWTAELELHPDLFPIRRYGQFEDSLNR